MSLLKGKVNIYLYIREESFPSSNFMRQNQTISPYRRIFIASFGHCYTVYMQSLGHHWTGELYSSCTRIIPWLTLAGGESVRPTSYQTDVRGTWDGGQSTTVRRMPQCALMQPLASHQHSFYHPPFLYSFPAANYPEIGWLGNCLNTVYVWIGGNEMRNFYVSFIVCLRTISILLMLSLLSSKVARGRVY